jgi:hypothetical protein
MPRRRRTCAAGGMEQSSDYSWGVVCDVLKVVGLTLDESVKNT